jgi:hypothetical protein
MTSALAVARIHFVRRYLTFVAPLTTIVIVALMSVLAYAVLMRTGVTSSPDYDPRINFAMMWGLPSLLGYLGVSMVATSFPFSLAVGATRRSYTGGTLLAYLVLSGYSAIVTTALLGLELATGHWFADMYIFDVYVLGAGNMARCALITFLGSLTVMTLGGVFAASTIRFRGLGPLGIVLGIVLGLGVFLIVAGDGLGALFAGFRPWWLVVAAAVVIVASSAGTYLFLRRAAVR